MINGVIEYLKPYLLFSISTAMLISLMKYVRQTDIICSCNRSLSNVIYKLFYFILVVEIVLFCAFRVIGVSEKAKFITHGVYLFKDKFYLFPGGADSVTYKKIFLNCINIPLSTALKVFNGIESGYIFISWVFANIGFKYELFLSFYYIILAIAFVNICFFVKEKKDFFSYIIYVFSILTLFIPTFNTFRNNVVLLLSVYVLDALIKNNFKKANCIVVSLSLIHISVLIWFLPIVYMYLCNRLKGNRFRNLIFMLLVTSCFPFIFSVLLSLFPRYQHYLNAGGSVSYFWLLTYVIVIIEVYINKKHFFTNKDNLNLFFIFLSFIPVFSFQLKFFIFYRFMFFSRLTGYILLLKLIKLRTNNILLKTFNYINFIIFGLVIIGFLSDIYYCGLPYRNIFFEK